MEKVLNEQIVRQIHSAFEELHEPVQILFFGSKKNCEYCEETRQLLEEVTSLNEKLESAVYDIEEHADTARSFNVSHAPGIVIAARDHAEVKNLGVQFTGIPSGHEFSTLINDIVIVSRRDSGLNEQTRQFLKDLDEPLLMQVFVTPS